MPETVQEVLEKFLDGTGVSQLWALTGQEIEARIADIKTKLATVAEGAQVNVIEGVQVNGVDLQVSENGKKVNVLVPTGALASLDEVAMSNLTAELQNVIAGKADKATTLAGYGITDAYTKEEADTELAKKADKATTLAGYGITDAYTKQVLSYQFSNSLEVDFVLKTVELLLKNHGMTLNDKTLIHSDQGCHYTSISFRELVRNAGLRQSMSRKGNCWDNAPQESFFGHMKSELKMQAAGWKTPEEASNAIDDWMDYYNNDRYQKGLENLAPNEYYQYTLTGKYPVFMQGAEINLN